MTSAVLRLWQRIRVFLVSRLWLSLLKLRYKLELLQLKSAVKVRNRAFVLLQAELRARKYPDLLPGDDEIVDDILFVAACEACAMTVKGVDSALVAARRAHIDDLKRIAEIVPECRTARITFYELQILIEKLVHPKTPDITQYEEAVQAIGAEPREVTVSDLYGVDKDLVRRIKELRQQIKAARAFKIDVPADIWGPAISLGSAIFLVSGYLYNSYVLKSFGIEVSYYFGLADYLAASIENIRYAAFAAVSPLVGLVIGLIDRSRKSSRERERERKLREPMYLGTVLLISGLTVIGFLWNRDIFFVFADLTIILLAIEISPYVGRHFAKPLPATVAAMVFITYAGTLAVATHRAIYNAELQLSDAGTVGSVQVTFSTDAPVRGDDLMFLAANSSYFFFVDRKTKAGTVVPKDQIKAVFSKGPHRK